MPMKTSIIDIVTDHYDTLRDDATQKRHLPDYFIQHGVPALVAVAATAIGFRFVNVGDLIAGLAIMTGFTFGLLVFVFQLRLQITNDPRHHEDRWLKRLIDQLFQNVAYALLVGFAAVVAAVIASTAKLPDNPLPDGWASAAATLVLTFLSLHYVMTMAMCAKRLNVAYGVVSN